MDNVQSERKYGDVVVTVPITQQSAKPDTLPADKRRSGFTLIRHLLAVTKPGIIAGNLFTAIGGFAFASAGSLDYAHLFFVLISLLLIIASAGVFNNYIDRDIDPLMERTQYRAMVTGQLSAGVMLLYGSLLFVAGAAILYLQNNHLVLAVTTAGFLLYIVPYSLWLKRNSSWGTFIGSFSGAIPPVAGYCAVSGQLDTGAAILFFILVAWQMAHFSAIALYRLKDYQAASIPVLPAVKGLAYTQKNILIWIGLFSLALVMLNFYRDQGWLYLIATAGSGLCWLGYGVRGMLRQSPAKQWGRQMFFISLISIFIFSGALCIALAGRI